MKQKNTPAMHVYNTLSRTTQELRPLENGKIRMYSCGPTVYAHVHIGNLRAFLFADLLKRTLRHLGLYVYHVMNITDVDDKIIRDAQAAHKSREDLVAEYERAFFDDLNAINVNPADEYPRATEHIPKMQELIQSLLDQKLAYLGADGSIYYAIKTFPHYGKLAHIDLSTLKEGASGRVKNDEYTKEEVRDFALWKAYEPTDRHTHWNLAVTIDGKKHTIKGRPGWHIECSAMSTQYLGDTFDIHTGGVDLIFPHHENEIAQSEGATRKPFAQYWMHNEHLVVDGKKMSKSLGNFHTLRDILAKGHSPLAFRYLILSAHYRSKQNFTFDALDAAQHSVDRLQDFTWRMLELTRESALSKKTNITSTARREFTAALANDLDTPAALESLFNFIKTTYQAIDSLTPDDAHTILEYLREFNDTFDILSFAPEELPDDIRSMITQREEARALKNWAFSDELRDELKERGYLIEDTPHGMRWKKIK